MSLPVSPPFAALCDHLASRRSSILRAWRKAVEADPVQRTARALTRGQFNDHIPEVLDAFEHQLRARPGGADARAAENETKVEEIKHGLHRWQQGYRLQELMHEWGHLQLCVFDEVEDFAVLDPTFHPKQHMEANRQWIGLVNEAITESAAQYERLQQAEAAGRLGDLTLALEQVNTIERKRAELIHQAVHDISSNVYGVSVAAKLLGGTALNEVQRGEIAALVQQGARGVTTMLRELMELARLEAGQEQREIARFNVTTALTALGEQQQPIARERGLFLRVVPRTRLFVDGDAGKVCRLVLNLVGNALKYTKQGGVTLSWGQEKENWWLLVQDTGPGLLAGPGAPIVVGLKEATASARESDEKTAATAGETSQVLTPTPGESTVINPTQQQPGEGVGLSIVKRLCELLDASIEVASSASTGTSFRIVFPRSYATERPSVS